MISKWNKTLSQANVEASLQQLMAFPSMSATLRLLSNRNLLRKTNELGIRSRMLLNAIASMIWQYFFLMYFFPAKTQVQHLRASFTEALPEPDFQADFARTGIWEEVFDW